VKTRTVIVRLDGHIPVFRRVAINYDRGINAYPVGWKNGTQYKLLSEINFYEAMV